MIIEQKVRERVVKRRGLEGAHLYLGLIEGQLRLHLGQIRSTSAASGNSQNLWIYTVQKVWVRNKNSTVRKMQCNTPQSY